MFTGIIEATGLVVAAESKRGNLALRIQSDISSQLKPDQSVAHNGICLTVTEVSGDVHTVVAVAETISKTTIGSWQAGQQINLERCMAANGRFDGHIVQGHVDEVAICTDKRDAEGSWIFRFRFSDSFARLIVEKGSVCVNGTSLTCFDCSVNEFSVAIVPYTFEHTNLGRLKPGDAVNLEFDVIGKYVQRMLQQS